MKNTFLLSVLILVSTIAYTQNTQLFSPEEIVQKNLDYYNQRDIQGFISLLSDNVSLYEFKNSTATATGIANVKRLYKKLFQNSPELHSTLLKRIVIGKKVIDHESIVGRNGLKSPLELAVIYEVEEQKIIRLTILRKDK